MTRVIVYFLDNRKLEIVTRGNAEDIADNFRNPQDDIVGFLDKDDDVVVINWKHVTYAYCYNEGKDNEEGGEKNGE